MSDPRDDKTLDEYLQRESTVSQHYRSLDSDAVPPALDSAVMARAREALVMTKSNKRPAWTRWSAPIALAASLVVGVAVVFEVGVDDRLQLPASQVAQTDPVASDAASREAIEQVTEQPLADTTSSRPQAPFVPPPPATAPVSPRTVKARDSATLAQKREAPPADSLTTEPSATYTLAGQPPSPAPAAAASRQEIAPLEEAVAKAVEADQAVDEREAAAREDRRFSANAEFSRARSPSLAQAPAPAMRQTASTMGVAPEGAPRLEPVPWLEQIRTLRREGKVLEADEQWRSFSEAYPQFAVAPDDFARPKP